MHLVLMVNFNFPRIIKEALTDHLHKTAIKSTIQNDGLSQSDFCKYRKIKSWKVFISNF